MTKVHSEDLRSRVLLAMEEGASVREAAERFSLCVSTVGAWRARYYQTGETKARKQGVRPGSILDRYEEYILGLMLEQPDITLQEIVEHLAREYHVMVCQATVWNFFDKRRISFKKNLSC